MQNDALKAKVKQWWHENPFTYLLKEPRGEGELWAFFRNVDRKVIKWMSPWAQVGYPLLGNLINYDELRGKKVLDIACGTGWSTEQFARMGAQVTAIDISPSAVAYTKKRFELFGLRADAILEADAEHLPFPDESFDFVNAFGCLMHTPDTEGAIREIYRVLKPGGRAAAMMYYKNSIHWRYAIWFGRGILRGKLLKMSAQELTNRYTDGVDVGGNMLTKFYTKREFRDLWRAFPKYSIRIFDRTEAVDYLPHRKLQIGRLLPHKLKELIVSRWGQTAWIEVEK